VVGDSRRAGGVVAFARAEWRNRWRSHLVAAVLTAITASVVLATFAAAARSRTAFDRLRAATHASDLVVHVPAGDPAATLQLVRQTPGVIDARATSLLFVRPEGTDLLLFADLLAIAPRIDDPTSSVDTAIVTEGRAPTPDSADEVALSATLADELGVAPGDRLRLETMTEPWVQAFFNGRDPGTPDGPRVTTTVTGIVRSPAEFGVFPSMIHLTAGFVDRYDGRLARRDDIHVRLEPGALQRHQSGSAPLVFGSGDEESFFVDSGTTQDALETIAVALWLVGSIAGLAGAVAIAVALARASRASLTDRSTIVAFGWTRADQHRALALTHLPALVVGLAAGISAGVLASPGAMVGLAGAIDPRPDSVLISSGLLLAVTSGTVAAAALLLGAVGVLATRRASRVTTRVVGVPLGRPLAVVLGLRQALVAPADRGGRASRWATTAVVGAAAVACAALVVSSSIGRLQSDPSLTGQARGRVVDSRGSPAAFDEALPRLEADDRVAVLAANYLDTVMMAGLGPVGLLVNEPRRGQIEWSVTDGRMPRTADEIALGPATLEAADVQIDEEIEVSGYAGTGRFRVVGTVLFPEGFFEHDQGVAVTVDGGAALLGDVHERALQHQVVFEWAEGVDARAADRELTADGLVLMPDDTGIMPGRVNNLGQVEQLPRQLALLVGLLAFATLLHAVWTGVVLRARELVTLRALGVTRRSVTMMTWTHTLAIVAIGVSVGAPVGLVVGRQTWRPIAENAHVVVRAVLGWSWLGVVFGAALLAGVIVAALAARWAGRLRPAVDLRAE
jgi:hypothetical protein